MTFSDLVSYFQKLEATPKRLTMSALLADLFQKAESDEIAQIVYFLQGELLPPFHGINIGMAEKYLLRAICQATGVISDDLLKQYHDLGDIGKTAEACIASHPDSRPSAEKPTVAFIYQQVYTAATISGDGSVDLKIALLAALLANLSGVEAKYVTRFVAGKLRLGVGDATILDALALAYWNRVLRVQWDGAWDRPSELGLLATTMDPSDIKEIAAIFVRILRVQLDHVYHVTSDLGLLAKTIHQGGIEGIAALSVRFGYPIRPALCERLSSPEEIFEKIGPCAIEIKYDGFRCQAHKQGDEVILFSRNQERTTPMFPEIVEALKTVFHGHDIILEGEVLAVNEATGEAFPFQVTLQRKRKHGVEEMAQNVPLKFFLFDLLFLDGADYTPRPYTERQETLKHLLAPHPVIEMAEAVMVQDAGHLAAFFQDTVERGFEGIVAKRPESLYAAGSRNFNWIKLKRSYKGEMTDTLDLCIVGYFFGKGARAAFGIGTILAAVYDPAEARVKTVSKIGTGFSEAELCDLKPLLDAIRASDKPNEVDSQIIPDVWVFPKYVVTVAADEITRSRHHTAGRESTGEEGVGLSLRFPRITGFIRPDKGPHEATTVAELIAMYHRQQRSQT